MASSASGQVDDSTREINTVAKEFVGLALAACVVGVVFPILEVIGGRSSHNQPDVWDALTVGGHALYGQVGWAYGVAVTALLGLFVATWGGQLFGDEAMARNVRRTLGFTGEVIAALAVPVMVFVLTYCLTSATDWAGLVVVIPAFGLIVFLGLQLGRFSVLDKRSKLANVEAAINKRDARLKLLQRRSASRMTTGLVVATLVPTSVVLAVSAPLLTWTGLPRAFAADAGFTLALNGIALFTLRAYLKDLTRSRWTVWVGPAFLLLVLCAVLSFNAAHGLAAGALILGTLTVVCLLSTFLPRRRLPQWLLNWTIGGLAAAAAQRSLDKQQIAAQHERQELAAAIATQTVPDNWRTRLIGLLERTRPSDA